MSFNTQAAWIGSTRALHRGHSHRVVTMENVSREADERNPTKQTSEAQLDDGESTLAGRSGTTHYTSYRLMSESATSRRNMILQRNGTPKYTVRAPTLPLHERAEIYLADVSSPRSAPLATASVMRTKDRERLLYRLDDPSRPDTSDGRDWRLMAAKGSAFEFTFAGQTYCWMQTHDLKLTGGSGSLSRRCFKLVRGTQADQNNSAKDSYADKADPRANGREQAEGVLMVYLHSPWFDIHAHQAGEVRTYEDRNPYQWDDTLKSNFELVGLITILGVQQREREARSEKVRTFWRPQHMPY